MAFIESLRTWLWHFRKGGVAQARAWSRRDRVERRSYGTALAQHRPSAVFDPMDMPSFTPVDAAPTFAGVRVGVIMDDFSLASWSNEFDVIPVSPQKWREELADGVDLLFVEAAWAGNSGAWQHQLTGAEAPSAALQELVSHCRAAGIPALFWNKEDPPHFEDFFDTAMLFDHVFTTDSNMVPRYRERLGHDRVHTLAFAAQPAVHNPIRLYSVHQRGDIAFAGMYFAHKFAERREQMDLLLTAAASASSGMESGLTIYSRFAGHDEKYQFPAPYDKSVVGSLPYDRMLTAYRAFKVFLNVNSVTDSPSMCARRVFEITASGTPVVSARSEAIPNFFPQDEIPVVDNHDEAAWTMRALVNSPELRDRMVHKTQRRIWSQHTYAHRAAVILEKAEIAADLSAIRPARVSVMASTNRPHQVDHVLQQAAQQQGVEVELVLLTHGFEADAAALERRARELGIPALTVLHADSEWSLGECLNAIVAAADGEYIAKFDDDDRYGDNYLLDQTNALRFSGAQIVGKQATYLYLEAQNAMLLRNPSREHRWTSLVGGPTLVGRRELFREFPFAHVTRGEDTDLLRRVLAADGRVYSADRFNFIQVRSDSGHTWDVQSAELMANARVVTYGLNLDHAMV